MPDPNRHDCCIRLTLGLGWFERFPLHCVISCPSVARGSFVCTKLLSSTWEMQLSPGQACSRLIS